MYVAPPVAVKVVDPPAHNVTSVPALIGALLRTETVTRSVEVHPTVEVPVTVYVRVEPGVKVTELPVVALKDVAGDHV